MDMLPGARGRSVEGHFVASVAATGLSRSRGSGAALRGKSYRHLLAVVVLAAGCSGSSSQPPPQGQWQPGGYGQAPPGQWPPGQQPAGQWQPGQPQGPQQPYPAPAIPAGPVPNDAINNMDLTWMRQHAASILNELVAALPADKKARVNGIPLVSDASPGEVNAYAGCDDQGTPFMATTDGLLEVLAFSSRFRATDEVFGGHRTDAYWSLVAQNTRPKTPLARPGAGFIDGNQDVDGRKVARQNVLFDASLGFVLGHELGHHYLGHTGCANGQASGGLAGIAGNLIRNATRVVPTFNQGNEVAADITGTYSVMTIGARRPSRFAEEGAMMTLNFFLALERSNGPADILFAFQATHPDPAIRIPIVQQAANTWRQSGGNPPPVLGY